MTMWAQEDRAVRTQRIGMKKTTPAGKKLYGNIASMGSSGSG